MKTLAGWIVAIGLLVLGDGPANATTITETINFTAHNFSEAGGGSTVPPVDPVMGSFTITLDPTVDTSFATAITFNNVNITPGANAPFFFMSPTAREGLLLCAHPLFLLVVAKQRGSMHLTSEW
jgi:hypothetical protein